MIYILGGASRSGKTTISRRAVSERGIPYFPLDALFRGLVEGVPKVGVTYDQPFIERAEMMWPITKPSLTFFLQEENDFLIEGDSLLPKQVSELMNEGNKITACFMGYSEVTKEDKLTLIRKHHQGELDWTKDMSDEEMLDLVNQMIEFSTYLKDECSRVGIRYFDVSHDFEMVRDEAFTYLFSNKDSDTV